MLKQTELIARISSILSETPDVLLAYLFGSQVSGSIGPLSDIDLGVMFTDSSDPSQAAIQLAHQIAKGLETDRVDVMPLRRAPIELAYAIIAQGVCVFKQDEFTRVEYEADVMSKYGDYLPVLRAMQQDILSGEGYESRV